MNRKGFTLIELLAVITILGIILVITVPNVLEIYKNSKLKNEEIFVGRLSDTIDGYVKSKGSEINFVNYGTATKSQNNSTYTVNVYKSEFQIKDIIEDKLITSDTYINSGNKNVSCSENARVEVYKDSDGVYCYKVLKNSLGCLSTEYQNTIMGNYAMDTCMWSK